MVSNRLTLGGGVGWLRSLPFFFLCKAFAFRHTNLYGDSGAHGYVVDNVVQVTIVTADGSIRTANSTENADLFWGIRGGGCNFGVVTEFIYTLHPQRKTVFAGAVIFAPNALEKLGPVIEKWWTDPDEKAGMAQILWGQDGNARTLSFLGLAEVLNKSLCLAYCCHNALLQWN
jgi:FAD/FMN-containing dehydrogenase